MTDPNSREERKRGAGKDRDDREPGGQVGKDKSPDRQQDLQGDSSEGGQGVPRKNPGGLQKDTKRR